MQNGSAQQLDYAAMDSLGRSLMLELFRSAATTEMRRNAFCIIFDWLIRPQLVVRSAAPSNNKLHLKHTCICCFASVSGSSQLP